MTPSLSRNTTARRLNNLTLRVASLVANVLLVSTANFAQSPMEKAPTSAAPGEHSPLTNDERAELLKLIRSLQQRAEKLEAAQATPSPGIDNSLPLEPAVGAVAKDQAAPPEAPVAPRKSQDSDDKTLNGRYTPNLGFRLANTEYGDLNVQHGACILRA